MFLKSRDNRASCLGSKCMHTHITVTSKCEQRYRVLQHEKFVKGRKLLTCAAGQPGRLG